ncbi:MAG: hypothetical protein JO269_02210 [Burkholderiaceae bacterium]|nr:hypothetical protein [Burkholderiaceae bacterium]
MKLPKFSASVVPAFLLAVVSTAPSTVSAQENGDAHGKLWLIADQFNNRVIEVDKSTHQIVWQFGNGSDQPGPHAIVGVNDAERVGGLTLISGTGIPPSSPPLPGCSTPAVGCADNRVVLVNHDGKILWQYGQAGVTGAGMNQLNTPVHSLLLTKFQNRPGWQVMITDQGNQRVIVVDRGGRLLWQYGTTGVSGMGPNQLNNPNSAELLDNGHILIADENNNRVIEVTPSKQIIFRQGMLDMAGNGFNLLNGPYDAKAIGDYTGLTPPRGFPEDMGN